MRNPRGENIYSSLLFSLSVSDFGGLLSTSDTEGCKDVLCTAVYSARIRLLLPLEKAEDPGHFGRGNNESIPAQGGLDHEREYIPKRTREWLRSCRCQDSDPFYSLTSRSRSAGVWHINAERASNSVSGIGPADPTCMYADDR